MATKPKAKPAPKAKSKTAAKPATKRKGELSDKELDAVAGGMGRAKKLR